MPSGERGKDSSITAPGCKNDSQIAGDRKAILSDHYIISTKIYFFDSIDPSRT